MYIYIYIHIFMVSMSMHLPKSAPQPPLEGGILYRKTEIML